MYLSIPRPAEQRPTHEVTLEAFTSNDQLKFRLQQMLNENDSGIHEAPLLWYLNGNTLHLWIGKTTYPRLTDEEIAQARADSHHAGVQMFKSLLSAMLVGEDNETKGVALKRMLESLPAVDANKLLDPFNPFNLMRQAAIELLEPPVEWAETLEEIAQPEPNGEA